MLMKLLSNITKFPEIILLTTLSILICFSVNHTAQLLITLFLLIFISFSTEYIVTNIFRADNEFNIRNVSFAPIIFLISDVKSDFFLVIFAIIIAHFLEHTLKFSGKKIFNNLAFAIFLLNLFGLNINWWGINISTNVFIITVLLGLIITYLKRELRIIFLFLIANIGFNLLFTVNPLYSIKQVFVPGYLFFTLFLLTKNSIVFTQNTKFINIYVIIASLLSIIISKFGFFTDSLISSIVVTDFAFFSIKFLPTNNSINV